MIPDALPLVYDGRHSVKSELESATNRKELNEVMDNAAESVARRNTVTAIEEIIPPENGDKVKKNEHTKYASL